jgi:hypothetical protein
VRLRVVGSGCFLFGLKVCMFGSKVASHLPTEQRKELTEQKHSGATLRGCAVAWLRGCAVAWGARVGPPTSQPSKKKELAEQTQWGYVARLRGCAVARLHGCAGSRGGAADPPTEQKKELTE